jgi:hypothetical protein
MNKMPEPMGDLLRMFKQLGTGIWQVAKPFSRDVSFIEAGDQSFHMSCEYTKLGFVAVVHDMKTGKDILREKAKGFGHGRGLCEREIRKNSQDTSCHLVDSPSLKRDDRFAYKWRWVPSPSSDARVSRCNKGVGAPFKRHLGGCVAERLPPLPQLPSAGLVGTYNHEPQQDLL